MERVDLRTPVLAALAIVYLVWGSTYLAIKVALEALPPMLLGSVRFLAAGVVLYGWAAWRRARRPATLPAPVASGAGRAGAAATSRTAQWRTWLAATVAGVTMLVGGNGAVTWAEQQIDSGVAALLVATVPLWMALLGRLQGERLPRRAVIGLVAGFAGVALLVRPAGDGTQMWSAVVVVLGALAWAGGSLYSRRAPLPADALRSTSMQMLAAGVVFGVIGAATGELGRLAEATVTSEAIAAVAYLAVFGSIVAFSAYTWLLRAAPPAVVGTYAYVNPLVAVLLGSVLLAEPVTAPMLLSGAMIIAGVALIVTARARPRHATMVAGPASVPEPATSGS